jgi:hypothetical protein
LSVHADSPVDVSISGAVPMSYSPPGKEAVSNLTKFAVKIIFYMIRLQ